MKKNIKLLLLILFAMGGYIVSFDTIHHKVVSFNTAYAIDEENYDYDTIGRTNKPDASLKAEEPVIPQAVLDAISFIPGLNTAVSAITFVAKIGINLDVDFTGVSVNFMDVFISAIQILDPSSSANSESVAAVAIQQTFHSNLYCGFQRIYLEETSLISKNNPIGKGGGAYPMFPVYPLNIQVNENTGQCDLETGGVLSDSLKNVSGFVYTDETKCSFSYSATEKQCIYDYNMPYIITTNAAEIAAEVACFALSINAAKKAAAEKAEKESMEKSKKQMKEQVEKEMKKEIKEEMQEQIKEKIEKEIRKKLQDEAREAAAKAAKKAATSIAVKMSIKLAGRVLGDFADVFTDERYALDPVTLIGLIELGGLGGALFDFLVDVVTSPLTVGMSASCFAIKASTLTATAQILKTALLITTTIKYNDANNAIKKFTFCGHNWLSYARTGDRKYWERGMYAHSYYKTVSDCINSNNCSSTVGTVCVNPYNDSRFCSGINPTTKHIKNKVYREYVFGGMEYEVGFLEMDISSEDNRSEAITYKSEDCIDPRTPEQKGYDGVLQRYYMRGNERANYACGRFNHDGKSGCYLLASDVEEEDKNATGVKMVRGGSILSSYYLIPSNNVELANKYADRCRETFARARECCKHRGKHLACITNKTNGNFTFCLSNVLDTYSSELMPNLITALTFTNSDLHKGTCNLDDVEFEVGKKIGTNYACVYSKGLCPYNFKLNAGLNYKASYCDGDYFPDYKDPDSILRRGNSHLNVDDCKKGLFGAQYRAKYKEQFVSESVSAGAHTFYKVEQDMAGFNERDFNTIYDFDKILNKYYSGANTNPELVKKVFNCGGLTECRNNVSNIRDKGFVKNEENVITQYNLNAYMISNIKTSAYGKIKNFCQYRAHCVEVDKENEYSYLVIYTSSLFLDSSCGGKSNTSRHTLQIGSAIPKQLSAPIVECVTESLKNLINGVAGASLCKEGFEVNNEGYCGADTEELVKTHYQNDNRAYFEAKYQKVNNTYIIKGYKMPDTHNPFLKIQKYCINVIKAAMTLFIVVYFYKQLLTGKIGDLAKQESLMKLVFLAFKFSVVATLIFYNGWQNGIYQRLVNFSTSGYEFINSIFLEITKNPLNQILNLDDNIIIRVARVEGTESTANILCFRYNAFREIDYALVDPVTRACPRWYRRKNLSEIIVQQNNDFPKQNGNKLIISRNQEISRLLYFVDKHNETSPVEDRIEILGVGDIWSNRYDGCYFDTTEYPKNKSYLSIFDTLDCKFVNYLGFSANDGAPNILILSLIMLVPNLILPDSILTKVVGFLGSALFGAILTFLFVMFNLMIKVVYMFTSATFTISILVFVSPIVLPLMFFERTKKSYETWFGMVIDTTLKPMLNISFVILYINILDKILFKGITFSKHSNIGRGPNLECIEDTPTFLCYITNPFSPAYVRIIFSSMILTLGMNLLIAYLLFHLADEFLGQLEEVSNSLFEFGGSADTTKANFKSEGVVGNAAKSASETGAAIEEFRQNYLDKIPGTLYGKIADSESAKSNKGVGRIAAAVRTLKYGKQGTLGERGFTGTDAIRDCLGNKIAKLGKWANLSNRMENAKDKAHNKLGRPYLKRKEGVAELRNQSIKIAEQKKKIQNLMRKEKTKEDKERKKEDDEIKELRDELRKNEEKLKKLSVYEERKKKKLEKKIRDIRNKEEKLNKKNEEERENRRKEYVAKLNKMRGEMLKMRKKKKEGEILSKYKAGADSDDYWEGKGTSDVDDYYDDIESESTPEKRLEYLKRKRKEREEEILDHLSKMGVLEAINEEIKKENKDKEKKKEKKMSSKEEEEYRKKRIEEAKKEYELENEYNDALRKMRKK